MAESRLAALQAGFTAHLRDPARHPAPPDVAAERVALYRELLLGNVDEFLARAFPVLHACLGARRWQALVAGYFAGHRARTPLFPRMASEFLRWLDDAVPAGDWPPFLRELAHYEWLEAEVLFDPQDATAVAIDADADLLTDEVVPNPVLRSAGYRYAVHRIRPEQQPVAPASAPVWLVVYRKRDDTAGFMELNAVAARLLDMILARDGRSGRDLLAALALELKHPRPTAVIETGHALLLDFHARDIVLGARRIEPR